MVHTIQYAPFLRFNCVPCPTLKSVIFFLDSFLITDKSECVLDLQFKHSAASVSQSDHHKNIVVTNIRLSADIKYNYLQCPFFGAVVASSQASATLENSSFSFLDGSKHTTALEMERLKALGYDHP